MTFDEILASAEVSTPIELGNARVEIALRRGGERADRVGIGLVDIEDGMIDCAHGRRFPRTATRGGAACLASLELSRMGRAQERRRRRALEPLASFNARPLTQRRHDPRRS